MTNAQRVGLTVSLAMVVFEPARAPRRVSRTSDSLSIHSQCRAGFCYRIPGVDKEPIIQRERVLGSILLISVDIFQVEAVSPHAMQCCRR